MSQAKLLVSTSEKDENMLWATGIYASDGLIFLQVGPEKIMVVRPTEYGRARKEAKEGITVLSWQDIWQYSADKRFTPEDQMLCALQKHDVSSVVIPPDFSAFLYGKLVENGFSIEFQDPIFTERVIKQKDEIADIKYAQDAVEEIFPMILEILANAEIRNNKVWSGGEYITSEMLRKIFRIELARRDCVAPLLIITSGEQAVDTHCVGTGPLEANTPIVFDIFPRSCKRWYFSDMTRTVVKGRLSPERRGICTVVLNAQLLALEMVKPGADFGEITLATRQRLEIGGFKTGHNKQGDYGFFHGIGHGVGLAIHEPPLANKGTILEEGNVITIEPGLYYPGVGGVRIEDTVVVTKDGYENLAHLAKEIVELP